MTKDWIKGGVTKWRKSGFAKKIQFRGTEQKTAVPCGFRVGVDPGYAKQSQRFGCVKITHFPPEWEVVRVDHFHSFTGRAGTRKSVPSFCRG